MAEFTVNPDRVDPYKNFKFRVKWEGRVVAGISRVSPLIRRTEVIEHRNGAAASRSTLSPGRTAYESVTLERGVTHDPEFERWANQVASLQGDAAVSLKNFRRDIIIDLLNEQDVVVLSYRLFRCWVKEYQALPELDANETTTAIERIVIVTEGWERDESIAEPAQT